jgi:hypothetical protein
VNGGRNYNGPKVNDSLALVKSGYMLEGLSIPRYLKLSDNALGADNQQERPVGRNRSGAPSARFVEARFQSCRKGGKIDGASAPEVSLPLTGILRDYMPDSNEKFVGKDIVRTAWRHAESGRNVHSSPLLQAKS